MSSSSLPPPLVHTLSLPPYFLLFLSSLFKSVIFFVLLTLVRLLLFKRLLLSLFVRLSLLLLGSDWSVNHLLLSGVTKLKMLITATKTEPKFGAKQPERRRISTEEGGRMDEGELRGRIRLSMERDGNSGSPEGAEAESAAPAEPTGTEVSRRFPPPPLELLRLQ